MQKKEILMTLQKLKTEVVKRYHVREMGLFGSYVRGEENKESDIDILVDFEEAADLFDLTGLGMFLEERFNHKVDIVSKRAVREELKDAILGEVFFV